MINEATKGFIEALKNTLDMVTYGYINQNEIILYSEELGFDLKIVFKTGDINYNYELAMYPVNGMETTVKLSESTPDLVIELIESGKLNNIKEVMSEGN